MTATLPNKDLLTPREAAEYFRVKPKTIYLWVEMRKLDGKKINGVLRIPRIAVLKKMEESTLE
jgi:excisionase family DNA binding protein